MAMFLTLVAELRSATTDAAGIGLNGVSMMYIILSAKFNDKCSHLRGSFLKSETPGGCGRAEIAKFLHFHRSSPPL
ncbi:hypothetical protein [Escherichia coli]|uniref:hypothetical protein n=1 Tax=Escherichia coli TaxID=562 RepID=UPI003314D763